MKHSGSLYSIKTDQGQLSLPGIQSHLPGILIYTFVHAGLESLSGVPLSQAFADVQLLLEELQQLFSFDAAKNDPRKVHRQGSSCDVDHAAVCN